ncbi:MAG: hypothetical protein ACJASF_000188 [Vicingaceae bacterium]|jgi:hypothetical protein
MKNFNYKTIGIVLVTTLFSLTACEKFLDLEPPFSQDADNYFTEPSHYELALIGAYDLLQGSFINLWIGEIASDNSIAGGESVTDSQGLHEIEAMTHGAVNRELRNVFQWNYAGITRANFILENKNNIDFDGKGQIIAEATFLRGYYYFQLVKYFGAVPLVIDERLGADDVTEIKRSSRADVYAQIEADLNFAASNLNPVHPVKGRVNKWAALAVLGKVQLYQNKFAESAVTLDQVINSNQYQLISDYRNLFTVGNEGHSESVFDVQYSGLEGGSYDCLICLEGNAAVGFQGIRQYNGPIYSDGNSYNLPTQDLYASFEAADTIRRNATILDLDSFIGQQANPAAITYAIGGGGHTGLYNNKYIKKQGELGLPDNDLTSPVNYVVIRYADVLLMAAEAHSESNNPGQALSYLNQVRSRVNLPSVGGSGLALTEAIWAERRAELSGEGHRFFDLVRTGQAASKINGFQTGKHELFAIPQIEISLAGGNWSQNQGY